MTSRSNSARAAKTWKISLPPLVVVSICSVRLLKPIPRSCSPAIVSIRCGSDRPSRSSFQTTRVSPLRAKLERLLEAWPIGLRAAGGVGEDPLTAGLFQRILLERERLIVGGDPSIANKHVSIVS